ncbi:hypothetical protein NL64_21905 [Pseudomonas fluorescens]|nr:hypothetical protein NL64_21905 [Pseudomonas fluorescens]
MIFEEAPTIFRAGKDSMTATLSNVDAHAQTDGSQLSERQRKDSQVSSKRPPKKLAIGLIPF